MITFSLELHSISPKFINLKLSICSSTYKKITSITPNLLIETKYWKTEQQ